jgi:hypothetical protein
MGIFSSVSERSGIEIGKRRTDNGSPAAVRSRRAPDPPKGDSRDMSTTSGPDRFANLMVRKEQDGSITFDPQVMGTCVISLHEESAKTLRNLLTEWLG